MANYGNFYGKSSFYGNLSPQSPAGGGSVNKNFYCIQYSRFQLSGVNLGLYTFEINPSTYNVFPQRNTQYYKTIMNFDPPVDLLYNKIPVEFSWVIMPQSMLFALRPYTRRQYDGTQETLYFNDQTYGRFPWIPIYIDSFDSQSVGGFSPLQLQNAKMVIRQVNNGSTTL